MMIRQAGLNSQANLPKSYSFKSKIMTTKVMMKEMKLIRMMVIMMMMAHVGRSRKAGWV